MRRVLSSELTFFMKMIFPTVWIGGFATGMTVLLVRTTVEGGHGDAPEWAAWVIAPCVLAFGTAIAYWTCIRLKAVSMDDESLYVSNYLTEDRVPLSEVETVVLDWWNTHHVTVTFVRPGVFGRSITFMLRVSFFKNDAAEKVEQIRAAVAAARLAASTPPAVLDGGASSDAIAPAPGGIAPVPSRTEISSRGPGAIRGDDNQC